MINFTIPNFIEIMFQTPKAACTGGHLDNELDDSSFGNLEGHAKPEDYDREEPIMPGFRRPARRPHSFDVFMNPVKLITKKVENIKGFRFEVTGPATHKFMMSHTWNVNPQKANPQNAMMGMKGPAATYQLGIQYIGGNVDPYSPSLPSFTLSGRMESTGKLEAVFNKHFDERTQMRVSAIFPNSDLNHAMMHCDLEYEGDDYVHTFKYGTNMWGLNFMQTIGNNLTLGFDLLNMSERKQSSISGALKYNWRKHSFFAHYFALQNELCLAYTQKVNKSVHLVSELSMNVLEGETKAVLGYRQKFTTTEMTATINSKGKINSIVNLMSGFFSLKLCATADYAKDSYNFGYGVSFGQPQ